MRLVLLAVLISAAISARENPQEKKEQWIFIGCRPTAAECIHSCSRRGSLWIVDKELCDTEGLEMDPLACFCRVHP